MLCSKRDDDRLVGGRGLELEIERSTKTFSEGETPSAIDSISEWRMQNKLHSARFVEEPLHHERLLRRNRSKRAIRVGEIIGDLLRRFRRQFQFSREPSCDVFAITQDFLDLDPKIRNRVR